MNEKNLKLLEIAGFTFEERPPVDGWPSPSLWFKPNGDFWGYLTLDLYNSLDAQLKWLVPKVIERGYGLTLYCQSGRMCSAHLFKSYQDEELGEADHLAHALAEAILMLP